MNKQKIIQTIEDNKHKFQYIKGRNYDYHDGVSLSGWCTLGLLSHSERMLNSSRGGIIDFTHTYGLNNDESEWIIEQNDKHCDSFDCMIEAIRNYKTNE
jgi:hypothetical protein